MYLIRFRETSYGEMYYFNGERRIESGLICCTKATKERAKLYYEEETAKEEATYARLYIANVFETAVVEISEENGEVLIDRAWCQDDIAKYPKIAYLHYLENMFYRNSHFINDLKEKDILANEKDRYVNGLVYGLFDVDDLINIFKKTIMKEPDLESRVDSYLLKSQEKSERRNVEKVQ